MIEQFCEKFYTAQKMKFSIKNFSEICDQTSKKLRLWSQLLKKLLIENFIFCAVLRVKKPLNIFAKMFGQRCLAEF